MEDRPERKRPRRTGEIKRPFDGRHAVRIVPRRSRVLGRKDLIKNKIMYLNLREYLIAGKEALADIQKHLNDGDAPPASKMTGELPTNTVICGDVLDSIKTIPDASIDCIITSPPYY